MTKKIFFIIIAFTVFSCEKAVFDKDNYTTNENVFEVFWKETDRNYSFFTYLDLNWDSVYNEYKPRINEELSDRMLFGILSEMANLLKDGHVNLFSDFGISNYSLWYTKYPLNKISINHYLESTYPGNNLIFYSKIKNYNIGYISISSFVGEPEDFLIIDKAINFLSSANGIIIDIRSNGGGNSSNADTIVSRFTNKNYSAFKVRYRNGTGHEDFTEWYEVFSKPAKAKIFSESKKVIVLTNRRSYSASEGFVAKMKVLPNTIIVGDTTGGGSGSPIQRQLPNSWMLRLSNTQTLMPDGTDFQFSGIPPDTAVWISKSDSILRIDTILETALDLISGN